MLRVGADLVAAAFSALAGCSLGAFSLGVFSLTTVLPVDEPRAEPAFLVSFLLNTTAVVSG